MYCPCQSSNSLTVCAFCGGRPNLAELDKCRPMTVKQSRIQKVLRWLINESKNSARSAVSFDGDCTARSTQFRPGCAQPDSTLASTAVSASTSTSNSVWIAPQVSDRKIADGDCLVPDVVLANVVTAETMEPTSSLFEGYATTHCITTLMNQYSNASICRHALPTNQFTRQATYVIPTGDAPLWEPSDELVLSKLWPHLDPFGLVGFYVERNLKISLDEQVNQLLNLYDSDFDATLFRQLACRVPKKKVARIAAALLEIDMDVFSEMTKESKDTKRYKATTEAEKHINRIRAELQSVVAKIHGTTAQMLDMRNEIRRYVSAFGMYTLFVTVNLANLYSSLR
ncbi:BQ5605_C008g04981 [Microbotryum silenes-dioicae]|uniref:BQ5605_C008g04981 protein n=1 Tax=Microbotryum silenes-dioicae TaxID=796604 RepID=A0A2X0MGD7_9BASI|nr:BQ5605_C008g04981 [Microbotryum silenes-dioicae]